MLQYRAEWSVWVLERSAPSVISKPRESWNVLGVLGAALICGGLLWRLLISLEEVRKKKESQNDILQQLLSGENNLKIKIFDIRNRDEKTFPAFDKLGSFMQGNDNEDLNTNIDGLGDSAQMDAVDGKVKIEYADLARDEPDGESDDDDLVPIKRGRLISCSTTNSLVDERMMDIVKTAKEARAMIRKLSFNPPEDGDEGVKFEMGWYEESEECVDMVMTSVLQVKENILCIILSQIVIFSISF